MATQQEDEAASAKLRESALMEKTAKAAEAAEAAKALADGAIGDRDKALAELEAAKAEIERLKAANSALAGQAAQDGLPPIPDLPKRAFQVVESVTAHTGPLTDGPDGKKVPRRLDLRRGEVVFVGAEDKEVEELRKKLGSEIRVFGIDKSCEGDLRKMGALR